MPDWFGNRTLFQKCVVIFDLISPVVFAFTAWRRLIKRDELNQYAIVYTVSYIGFLFWLFEAPDIRFGYGVLVSTLLLPCIPLIVWVIENAKVKVDLRQIFALSINIFMTGMLLLSMRTNPRSIVQRLVLPLDYKHMPSAPCEIHDKKLLCAEEYNECWYDPFPCIPPGSASQDVEMRSSSLRDGFRDITR
jgi:hypothetical protein